MVALLLSVIIPIKIPSFFRPSNVVNDSVGIALIAASIVEYIFCPYCILNSPLLNIYTLWFVYVLLLKGVTTPFKS